MANARKSREQRQQAQQEDTEKRATERRRRIRTVAVALVVVLIVGAGVVVLSGSKTDSTVASASPSGNLAQTLKDAGCGKVINVGPFEPADKDGSHDGLSPLQDYPSIPPASGPHVETTVAAGPYAGAPDLAAAIHSLEHGAAEIWYAPSVADSSEVTAIKDFIAQTPENEDHTIVAPYDYADQGQYGELPDGNTMALVSWHNVMTCQQPSLAVAKDFLSKYRYPPLGDGQYLGEAPEQGVAI
jgi:hypothetical protein